MNLPPLRQRIAAGLSDTSADTVRRTVLEGLRPRLAAARPRYPDLQERVRAIKMDALAHLDELVGRATEQLKRNGCTVVVARSAAEARDYVLGVVGEGTVVKSKSNAAKEVGVVEALEARRVNVVETDLGDRINQLNGTYGGHIIAPAIQISKERVGKLFSELAGKVLPPDPEEIVKVARADLRAAFAGAGYGLSGGNALAAETGTLCVVENEGNIRMLSSLPDVYIAIVPITKIVRTLEDALTIVQGASVFGVAQRLGTYASCIAGPAPAGGFGPREMHVVLVDNGRRRAVATGFGEAFACINCGSCLDHCPVYAVIGDKYGVTTHIGGIGLLQASFTSGLGFASEQGLSLCLNCRACVDPCPARIDTPGMHARLREEVPAGRRLPPAARLVLALTARIPMMRATGALIHTAERLSLRGMVERLLPTHLRAMTPLLPPMPAPREMARPPELLEPIGGPARRTVAFFAGCVMSTWLAPVNWATLRVLARAGCRIRVPATQGCCGALHHHMGEGHQARVLARRVIDAFAGLEDCEAVLTNSAGCGAAMKEYGKLLHDDPAYAERARTFASRVHDVTEFLAQHGLGEVTGRVRARAVYFDPCHLGIAQGLTKEPRWLLRRIPGLEVVEASRREGCCGSAGIYNLVHPEVSGRLADLLTEDLRATNPDLVVTTNPGCLLQVRWGLARAGAGGRIPVMHLMELLDQATGTAPRPAR